METIGICYALWCGRKSDIGCTKRGSNATVLTQMTQVAAFERIWGGGMFEGTSAVLSKGLAGIGQVLRKFFPAK